jgi:hypothetical protein
MLLYDSLYTRTRENMLCKAELTRSSDMHRLSLLSLFNVLHRLRYMLEGTFEHKGK